jgi:sugar phosphate isomerase/epimerase
MNLPSRRSALGLIGSGLAAAAFAPTNLLAAQKRMRLSLAAYSFRDHFAFMKGKSRQPKAPAIDMFDFIDFCAENGCEGAELTSYFFPTGAEDNYFRRIRGHAEKRGITVSGTAVGNNFSLEPGPDREAQAAYVREWIDKAALMGAPHVRIFAGKKMKGTSEKRADELVIAALKDICGYAAKKKVKLGLENHDSIATAERLIRLLRAVDSEWLGVNLDSGNFRTDDPYLDFELSAPHAVNVQMKTKLKIGDATHDADLPRFIRLLKKADYRGWVALEFEEKDDPYEACPPVLKQLKALL